MSPSDPNSRNYYNFIGEATYTNSRFTLQLEMFTENIDLHSETDSLFPLWQNISLSAFMDNFTYQGKCDCKAIFEIHVIALLFMCCGWSINWVKTYLDPTWIPLHVGLLWGTMEGTVALQKDKTTQVDYGTRSF